MRAVLAHTSVSVVIDEAVRLLIREDENDLKAVALRANEPEISYEALLDDLKSDGKI